MSENLPAIRPNDAIDFGHLSPETAIALAGGGREYRMTALDVIKWVAPAAPVSEAVKLLVVAQNVNLNPMLKEIELLDIKGAWHIYVRKQGLIKVAQRYPEYDGHETGVVVQIKDLSAPPMDVAGCITPRGYLLQGGWAKVYRKGWGRPVYKRCALQNYQKSLGIWQDNPAVMIEKVALSQALRESFPIGEVYDESELPGVQREAEVRAEDVGPVVTVAALPPPLGPPEPVVIDVTPPTQEATPRMAYDKSGLPVLPVVEGFTIIDVEAEPLESHEEPCTASQQGEMIILFGKLDINAKTIRGILAKRGVEQLDQLTVLQATQIIAKLTEKLSAKTFDFLADKPDMTENQPVN